MKSTLNRRSFLKRAALATSGLSSVSLFQGPNILAADSPGRKLNCALIGCGGRAMNHLDWLVNTTKDNIIAIVDPDEKQHAKVKSYLKEHNCDPDKLTAFTDYRVMFDKIGKQLDAVFIATPNHHHAPASILAMQLGKAVYCEKPLTHDIAEARKVREMASQSKAPAQMGNQGHASQARRTIKEILMTGVIGPVREVHVWAERAWGLQDAASAEKFDKPHGFYNGIQIVDRFKEAMPIPPANHFDLWLGPAPARPFHETYFPGPRWYRWWDFGNGTMSDLGSHDNDVPYTVLDIRQPLTIEATSPNGPVAHKELAPATMTVVYEFAASPSGAPPVKLVWHQGDSKPPGWVPAWGGRSQLFIGDHGMLLGDGRLLPEEKFKGFQTPPETLRRSPGHWIEWVDYAKERGPVPGSNFQYSGWTTEANHLGNVAYRTGKKIEWDYKNLRATNAPEAAPFIKRPEYRKGWNDILKLS